MKTVRLVAAGRPLETHEIPTPEPGPGEVLLRVRAAGVCHSDAHYPRRNFARHAPCR